MRNQKSALFQYFVLFFFFALGIFFLDRAGLTYGARGFLEREIFKLRGGQANSEDSKIEERAAKIATFLEETERLKKENETLRKQLQAPLPSSFEFIPAKVVSFEDTFEKKRSLAIFFGSSKDVKPEMLVVLENVMLGKIGKVGASISEVILLSDAESKITAKTTSGTRGLIIGGDENPKTVSFSRILQKEKVEVGSTVVTSGEDGIAPDILIGKVTEVVSNDQDPYKTAKVELFIEPSLVSELFIVKDS